MDVLHRYEKSGALSGITRVRTFCQDDAHIFCSPDQIESEIKKVVAMILETYKLFNFGEVKIYLSTRPEKRVGADDLWDKAEAGLKRVLDNLGMPYTVNKGDGAFYGPKIDFNVGDALKRFHQLGTIQLDFNLPERFDLGYVDSANTSQRPVMVHRAVFGSLERFIGILIEHVAGAFPFWLAPVQARVIPIGDPYNDYCRSFQKKLRGLGYRIEIDERNESMGLKTREVQMAKIPFALVAGEREMAAGKFAVRKYGERESVEMTADEVVALFASLADLPNAVVRKAREL